jgi:hypothetical protein
MIILSREPAFLAYYPGNLRLSANKGKLSGQLGGRGPTVVRNLPLLFIAATSLGASGPDIPPQGTSVSSIPVDWVPVVLAYHLGELTVSANSGNLRRQVGAGTH